MLTKLLFVGVVWLLLRGLRRGRRLYLPAGRRAYRCDESIEVAVVGAGSETVQIGLVSSGHPDRLLNVPGEGAFEVTAGSLAPGDYRLVLRGARPLTFRVVSGVSDSSMPWSEHGGPGNFTVTNPAEFTLLRCCGRPEPRPVSRLSPGMQRLDASIAANRPVLAYAVWSGTVTHQPWGPGHSWSQPGMLPLLRQATLHAAQRLRRFGRSIQSLGLLDEPKLTAQDPPVLLNILRTVRDDLKEVWPEVLLSTDLWVEGCDPATQQVNDIACSHIFVDRGCGKLGILSGISLARCYRPCDTIAHAMNGQLHGDDPGADHRGPAYRLMRNCLLAAGLSSHWWLNLGKVTDQEREGLNWPAQRWGPFFREWPLHMPPLALLWSPRVEGPAYREQILATHQALLRAGYACRILHEDLVSSVQPEVLLVVGSPPINLDGFSGRLEKLEELEGILSGLPQGWLPFQSLEGLPARAASQFRTTWFMDRPARRAAELIPELPGRLYRYDGCDLAGEGRQAGEGRMLFLLNCCEELPVGPENEPVPIYNHVGLRATVLLSESSAVSYLIEGEDLQRISLLESWPDSLYFEAGEMKVVVQAPRHPEGLRLDAQLVPEGLRVRVELMELRMPWPLELHLLDGQGGTVHQLWRATDSQGIYQEFLPLGANFASQKLSLRAFSPLGSLTTEAELQWQSGPVRVKLLQDEVRVWDEPHLQRFLTQRPDLCVVGPQSQALAAELRARGLRADSRQAEDISHKATYPRLWPEEVVQVRPDGPPPWSWWIVETGREPRARPGCIGVVGAAGWYDAEAAVLAEPGCRLRFGEDRRWHVLGGYRKLEQVTPELRLRWARPWRRMARFTGHRLQPQPPECWECEQHLVLTGDSSSSPLMAALLASELLERTVQADYPGSGRAFLSLAWSPFSSGYQAIVVAATEAGGLQSGIRRFLELLGAGC